MGYRILNPQVASRSVVCAGETVPFDIDGVSDEVEKHVATAFCNVPGYSLFSAPDVEPGEPLPDITAASEPLLEHVQTDEAVGAPLLEHGDSVEPSAPVEPEKTEPEKTGEEPANPKPRAHATHKPEPAHKPADTAKGSAHKAGK